MSDAKEEVHVAFVVLAFLVSILVLLFSPGRKHDS